MPQDRLKVLAEYGVKYLDAMGCLLTKDGKKWLPVHGNAFSQSYHIVRYLNDVKSCWQIVRKFKLSLGALDRPNPSRGWHQGYENLSFCMGTMRRLIVVGQATHPKAHPLTNPCPFWIGVSLFDPPR